MKPCRVCMLSLHVVSRAEVVAILRLRSFASHLLSDRLIVTELQYQSMQRLLDEFSAYATRAPNAHLRPKTRPQKGRSATKWWRYVGAVVQRQQKTRFTWQSIQLVCHLRREYVPHYIK